MFGSHKDTPIKRLLAIRFSAMGDAAMTVPVLHALATQHPDLRITMLTRTRFVPLFEWLPANVQVKGIDLEQYDGIVGLTRLHNLLKQGCFDAVADLHDVLRSKYLRTCFSMAGTRVAVVDKGRKEKKELIGNGLRHTALLPMTERYANVFRSLGLTVDLTQPMQIDLRNESFTAVRAVAGRKAEGEHWVGVAPFAAHMQKVYPLNRMQQVVNQLAENGCKVFLFGAGQVEGETLAAWERDYTRGATHPSKGTVLNLCGKLGGLKNEMLLISQLDVMITMDSANMHIASIFGTPVLSIWGATHPKAGFRGYGQPHGREVQLDLPCRPCSIYGKTPCRFGDLRCMNIPVKTIVEKVVKFLQSPSKT